MLHLVNTDPCQGFLPLLLAIYDYWYIQRRRPKSDRPHGTNGRASRHLLPAGFLAAAYSVKAYAMDTPRSTYICPLSSAANAGVPIMQISSLLLDCYVLLKISEIVSTEKLDVFKESNNVSVAVGFIFLVNA